MVNIGSKLFYIFFIITIISIILLIIFVVIDNKNAKQKNRVKHSTFYNVSLLIVSLIFLFSSIATYCFSSLVEFNKF